MCVELDFSNAKEASDTLNELFTVIEQCVKIGEISELVESAQF